MTIGGKWRIEGFHGAIWILCGRGAVPPAGSQILLAETAASQVGAWFPDGWLHGDHATLSAIAASLGEIAPGTTPEAVGRLKALVRNALRDGRLTAIRMPLPGVQGGRAAEVEEQPKPAAPAKRHTLDFLFE